MALAFVITHPTANLTEGIYSARSVIDILELHNPLPHPHAKTSNPARVKPANRDSIEFSNLKNLLAHCFTFLFFRFPFQGFGSLAFFPLTDNIIPYFVFVYKGVF